MEKDFDRCLRCNRKLKNKEARKIGYGKTCFNKLGEGYKVINLLDTSYSDYKWKITNTKHE